MVRGLQNAAAFSARLALPGKILDTTVPNGRGRRRLRVVEELWACWPARLKDAAQAREALGAADIVGDALTAVDVYSETSCAVHPACA